MTLGFVKNEQLDFAKWDKAIASSYNENPYAYSNWLNMVSPGWEAYIGGDYEVLIPLPVKTKLGIRYLSQPRFTQQLGIFSEQPVEPSMIQELIGLITTQFPKAYLQFNTDNYRKELSLKSRPTFQLSLNSTYELISKNFDTHHKRNISKALQIASVEHIRVTESDDYQTFIQQFKNTVGLKDPSLTENDYALMHKIISSTGKIILCTTADGAILAGLFYLQSKTRIVNLFNFTTDEGKNKKAMYLLLNQWIQQFAETKLILDFEGSEIPSIARFYAGFGATAANYQTFTKKGFWQL